jgi:hypothetical protein
MVSWCLCIPHQRAIVELYNVDIRRLERAKRYWEQRFSKEGQAVKEDIQG